MSMHDGHGLDSPSPNGQHSPLCRIRVSRVGEGGVHVPVIGDNRKPTVFVGEYRIIAMNALISWARFHAARTGGPGFAGGPGLTPSLIGNLLACAHARINHMARPGQRTDIIAASVRKMPEIKSILSTAVAGPGSTTDRCRYEIGLGDSLQATLGGAVHDTIPVPIPEATPFVLVPDPGHDSGSGAGSRP